MISVCAQACNFKRMVAADWSADDATKERINQWMDETLAHYASVLGMERILDRRSPK